MNFDEYFKAATVYEPYPYQRRLAEGESLPSLIDVPTGCGKTSAVVLAWLWRRCHHPQVSVRAATPRRLVYCLPMRVLVEQTRDLVKEWLERLGETGVKVHILMGGEEIEKWEIQPEEEAILIGTQDMILSRALNRGYGMSRFMWPVDFGLLNNDCVWVLDEVQLMSSGLATSAQLASFRNTFGVHGSCPTIWMSATLQSNWLKTVDFQPPREVFKLTEEDREKTGLTARLKTKKTLTKSKPQLQAEGQAARYAKEIAGEALKTHRPRTLTLIVVNTVRRARLIYDALKNTVQTGGGTRKKPGVPGTEAHLAPELRLVHSRFRPVERETWWSFLRRDADIPGGGRIVVSTQVVEAGVDVSAKTLFTELAPWTSLVQRFGRCNRYGEHPDARVLWIDVKEATNAAPYTAEELKDARSHLAKLTGSSVAPADLPPVTQTYETRHVLRRRDLLDLFDTTPDLTGNDVDVSRFIRDEEDMDAFVFWRELANEPPPEGTPKPSRQELCPVPFNELRKFLTDGRKAWSWDHIDTAWKPARPQDIRPGQIVMLNAADGGYSQETGWDPSSKESVLTIPINLAETSAEEGTGDDPNSYEDYWQTLRAHSERTRLKAEALLKGLSNVNLDEDLKGALLTAAHLHDAGKAHPVFQETLLRGIQEPARSNLTTTPWAKSANRGQRHSRPHFRHELATGLSLLQNSGSIKLPGDVRDLVVYLAASHHGKIRLSIRSLPTEAKPEVSGRFALGVWDGDSLPPCHVGGGFSLPATELDLSPMEIGRGKSGAPSWLERMLRLRDRQDLGPFRLAYLEALLRASDWLATKDPGPEVIRNV